MRYVLIFVLLLTGTAHAETLAALRYRTALRLGQDTSSTAKQWSDAEINTWVNDAIRYISHVSLCYVRETTFTMTIDSTDYTMSADYIRAAGVVIEGNPIGLKGTAAADLGKQAVKSNTPTQWEDLGEIVRKIRLSPKPKAPQEVSVSFYAYSRQLSGDTVNCLLPQAFQYCIPDYAASQCWGRTRLPDPYWGWFIDRLSVLVPAIQKGSDPEVPAASPGGQR